MPCEKRDSRNAAALEELKEAPGGRPLDFHFVDGDRPYEGVHRDFELYSPRPRRNGIIGFQVITTHRTSTKFTVPGPRSTDCIGIVS